MKRHDCHACLGGRRVVTDSVTATGEDNADLVSAVAVKTVLLDKLFERD